MNRLAVGLGLAVGLALGLAGCGPRNKIGDRYLGRTSITNLTPSVNGHNPAPPP